MSLQLIAKQMEAKGRKGDSMLVHMTPGEVAGLQKLAESAGGSLSVNPETGLVEANFLKRMLPTLVGMGVGAATMNPFAGAAAGAAVGGYQAKRNDQDVLLGAAMGGLGGYGGASMGAGLTAAGAPAVAATPTAAVVPTSAGTSIMNPAMMGTTAGPGITLQGVAPAATTGATAAPLTAAQGLSQAGQGISALGNEAGRGAFMSQVGGGAGLMSDVGMAAAPMMAPGKAPGAAPVDDEMYSYGYNPGRTGAERSPLATSSERKYFAGSYSPMRKIRANQYGMAQGGLLSLAEGGPSGTSSEGMTGASKAAFDYLMGRSATSGFAGQGAGKGSGGGGGGVKFSGDDQMYIFDPATGTYIRNPDYEDPEEKAKRLAEEARKRAAAEAARQQAQESSRQEEAERIRREEEEARKRATAASSRPPNATDNTLRSPGDYVDRYDHTYDPQRDAQGGGSRAPSWVGLPADMIRDPSDNSYDPQRDAQGGGSRGESWQSAPADMRGGDVGSGPGTPSDPGGYAGYDSSRPDFAAGGILGLAKGGMASGGFVVPADVVSALGNGSTDAGLRKLYAMLGKVKPIKGKGDGLSDSIPTNIDGKQPAKVADGEAYIDPKTVKRLGGAKKLYAMMDKVRAQAHGKTSQQRPVNPAKVMA